MGKMSQVGTLKPPPTSPITEILKSMQRKHCKPFWNFLEFAFLLECCLTQNRGGLSLMASLLNGSQNGLAESSWHTNASSNFSKLLKTGADCP